MSGRDTEIGGPGSGFPETPWSRILRAGYQGLAGETARADWERLARAYWRPAYLVLRRAWGLASEDAKDLTQAFFLHVLTSGFLGAADPARGRFRTFLRVALENFARDRHKAERREIRGGGRAPVSLDGGDLARVEALLPALEQEAPDRVFDAEWRRGLLEAAVGEVRACYAAEGRPVWFEVLERKDLGGADPSPSYAEIGQAVGLAEDAVRNHLHHARRRLREAILERVREYATSDAEVEEEVRELFG
ncbi:MAG: sigma-70 family RNA polymerase sigma factor [Planctomycetes bacterium]|nr:sigma-70 family RNA polymerase sigma factor [Planctomycetota bacterium]